MTNSCFIKVTEYPEDTTETFIQILETNVDSVFVHLNNLFFHHFNPEIHIYISCPT
jgi:hypothetical protein